MSRTLGARNAQFAERRNALIAKAKERLALQTGSTPSFRELALACGVSVATLRHYFGSREALIKAVFAFYLQGGQKHLARARQVSEDTATLEVSLHEFLQRVVRAWSDTGLSAGLALVQTALCLALFVAVALHVRWRLASVASTASTPTETPTN